MARVFRAIRDIVFETPVEVVSSPLESSCAISRD